MSNFNNKKTIFSVSAILCALVFILFLTTCGVESLNSDGSSEDNAGSNRPKTKAELTKLINDLIEKNGNNANLNSIDTSLITDMSDLFRVSELNGFNGDISKWDVSNVTDMSNMFLGAREFNGDISNWNVSNVQSMTAMFSRAYKFNGDISNWKVSNVQSMVSMFAEGGFNKDIGDWDTSSVGDFFNMFKSNKTFNQDLSKWSIKGLSAARARDMFLDSYFTDNIDECLAKFPQGYTALSFTDANKLFEQVLKSIAANAGKTGNYELSLHAVDVSGIANFSNLFNATTKNGQKVTGYDDFTFDAAQFNANLSTWNLAGKPTTGMFDGTALKTTRNFAHYPQNYYDHVPTSITGLKTAVAIEMEVQGTVSPDLRNIGLAGLNSLSGLFSSSVTHNGTSYDFTKFNGNISQWDVSNITDFSSMFANNTAFNQDITHWIFSAKGDNDPAINFTNMFKGATAFNQDLSSWDITGHTGADMITDSGLEKAREYNKYPVGYRTSITETPTNTTELYAAIKKEIEDQKTNSPDLSMIGVSKITSFANLFSSSNTDIATAGIDLATFNGYIVGWDVSHVTDFSNMFNGATGFNQNLSRWDLRGLTTTDMFLNATTMKIQNWPIGVYKYAPQNKTELKANIATEKTSQGTDSPDLKMIDTSSITDMSELFKDDATFNGEIGYWNTSAVTTMSGMFMGAAAFNQDINTKTKTVNGTTHTTWDTSAVTNMSNMFNGATAFDKAIGNWNTSLVTNMSFMFRNAINFNQNLNTWNTSLVTNMRFMFERASKFNQNLDAWDVSKVTDVSHMFDFSNYNQDFYGWWKTKKTWDLRNANTTNMLLRTPMDRVYEKYPFGYYLYRPTTKEELIANMRSETIRQGGNTLHETPDFHLIDTKNIKDMSYLFDFGDYNGNAIHPPKFQPVIYFWDVSNVENMSYLFYHNSYTDGILDQVHLNINLTDWDVSNVTNMSHMFHGMTSFNSNISDWNVSNVTDMSGMFFNAQSFNQDISGWDVSNVKNMSGMFEDARAFNSNVDGWVTTNVTDITNMFKNAHNFNQNIKDWTIGADINLSGLFDGAKSFNGNLSGWDISNVTNLSGLFKNATAFDQNMSAWGWDVSNVTTMRGMFEGATKFNNVIRSGDTGWNTTSLTDMSNMFKDAIAFNQDLSNWNFDTSKVTTMSGLFFGAKAFNGDIRNLNTGSVKDMSFMFHSAIAFNATNNVNITNVGSGLDRSLGGWDVSKVTNMSYMFYNTESIGEGNNAGGRFPEEAAALGELYTGINSWNVSNVTNMSYMFANDGTPETTPQYFADTLFGWGNKTGSVSNMQGMFKNNKHFNANICTWSNGGSPSPTDMFAGSKIGVGPSDNKASWMPGGRISATDCTTQ